MSQENAPENDAAARQEKQTEKNVKKCSVWIVVGILSIAIGIVSGAAFMRSNRDWIRNLLDRSESDVIEYSGEGRLEFRLVHPRNDVAVATYMRYLEEGGNPDEYFDTPPEAEFLSEAIIDPKSGEQTIEYLHVEEEVLMNGDDVEDAYTDRNEFGQYEILLFFNRGGTA